MHCQSHHYFLVHMFPPCIGTCKLHMKLHLNLHVLGSNRYNSCIDPSNNCCRLLVHNRVKCMTPYMQQVGSTRLPIYLLYTDKWSVNQKWTSHLSTLRRRSAWRAGRIVWLWTCCTGTWGARLWHFCSIPESMAFVSFFSFN
jgi:hypothetical protein